jgi:uncharacterized membrane protein
MLLTPSAVVVFAGVFAFGVGVAVVAISLRMALTRHAASTRKIKFVAILAAVTLFLAVLLVMSM